MSPESASTISEGHSSVSATEIAHFSALAEDWWNPKEPCARCMQ